MKADPSAQRTLLELQEIDSLLLQLRHHPASEFLEKGGPALVDVAHWAAEWTWLPAVEARLQRELGDRVETRVSTQCTDPWTFRPAEQSPPQSSQQESR